jgi:hypothetical protein
MEHMGALPPRSAAHNVSQSHSSASHIVTTAARVRNASVFEGSDYELSSEHDAEGSPEPQANLEDSGEEDDTMSDLFRDPLEEQRDDSNDHHNITSNM